MTNIILTAYEGKILGPIAKFLGWILDGLYGFLSLFGIENVGLSIILFTFIVNGLMIPLNIKQQKFSKMSSKMNPEIMEIQEKYKNKKDEESIRKMQMETQAVYTKYGVSPASGCLPLLITFPIFFALYRVIYNIPAYVGAVKKIYQPLADSIHNLKGSEDILASYIMGSDAAKAALKADEGHQTIQLMTRGWPDIEEALSTSKNAVNYIIDVLSQFKASTWDQLIHDFPSLTDNINQVMDKANHVNYFLGLDIMENPSLKSVSVLIPILAIVTQLVSTKVMQAGNPQPKSAEENPTMQTMQVMTNVMPFVSGFMCLMFPIGVGLYWVSNSLFRIIQTVVINAYLNRMDMDEEMNKNIEKMKRRYEKMGIDPKMMGDIAKKKTSHISSSQTKSNTTTNGTKNVSKNSSSIASKANPSGRKKTEPVKRNTNSKYKEGSIASYANMLNRNDSKEE